MTIAVITTFPNNCWQIYAQQALQSYVQHWPVEIPLMVMLDDDLLLPDVKATLRQCDVIAPSWGPEHRAFVERNKGKDHATEYRKQAVRFCHKVFAIATAFNEIAHLKEEKKPVPRYLIWMDADVITTQKVTLDDIKPCLPKEGDAVSYMGRKDWDHSECGWLAFNLENGGGKLIEEVTNAYIKDDVFTFEQWHDSYIWDQAIQQFAIKATNLTPDAKGMEVWSQSPMGKWSTHYKGPVAKQKLIAEKQPKAMQQRPVGVKIQTKNAIPNAEIQAQIAENQSLIKNWVIPCVPTDEKLIVVSAGPLLIAEDVRKEVAAGYKIVSVKNALVPLKKAGIKPWACILLDPRPHVADFIKDPDPEILWFVASQVNPNVTLRLLAKGCKVYGYHASVNAGEEALIAKQEGAIIQGGSATATRGLYTLKHLGFSKVKLYGYDLSIPDKPDLNETVEMKNDDGTVSKYPKYMELSVGTNDPLFNVKRMFFTEPQLIAQFEELNALITGRDFEIEAEGDGIIPFMIKSRDTAKLRREEMRKRLMGLSPKTYAELLAV